MPFGPFILQWRAPSPNPPKGSPLPPSITRSYIETPSGPLELLTALASTPTSSPEKPPLFFAHGGFGCAAVWLNYMTYFSSRGYPCYAISYRGHGNSWYPGFWRMYFTPRSAIGSDLVAGIQHVEKLETERRKSSEKVRVVLVAHSAGGALAQWVLGRGLVKVGGFCMCAAVPGFGSFSCYTHWLPTALPSFFYRLFHSRYLLATTSQVHTSFFTPSTPISVVKSLERLLSPYESMLWPVQGIWRFVTGPDVISSITGWKPHSSRLLVLAAEHDVLCKPGVLEDAAERYRESVRELVRGKKIDGVSAAELEKTEEGGVRFRVVKGVAHHLQNHVEWERGAEEVLEWVEQL